MIAPLLVEAVALTKRFKKITAVEDLSFEVRAGEAYCLLGSHGAGKATAMSLLLGLTKPTSGRAAIAGEPVAAHPAKARAFATYVSARTSLYGGLSARGNARFFASLATNAPEPSMATIDTALRRLGVPERVFDQPLGHLPAPIHVGVSLAIAALRDTPVLLVHEPTFGLDARASADLQEHLVDLKARGKALLLATSDVLLASQVADRVGILKHGRKVVERTRGELQGQTLTELYYDYVGRVPTALLAPR